MELSLTSLFISAFISSTLFPGGSEAVLAYLSSETPESVITFILVASLGNTLGAMTSWLLGWWLAKRYPLEKLTQKKQLAIERVSYWGSPALLFSWLPVIGDPLCLAAGWLGISWKLSLLLIAVGKTLRYVVIGYAFI